MGHFELRVGWTDTSYWDDGNRGTVTKLAFSTLDEVNAFIAKHLIEPYTFSGQEGPVSSIIEMDRLHLTEIQTIAHDVYGLPAARKEAETKYRKKLRDIAKWGGDLRETEQQVEKLLGWKRDVFLKEWHAAMLEIATSEEASHRID